MKPTTYVPAGHKRASSSGVADIKTITLAANTSAILLTAETTAARYTVDGSDPSAASAPSGVVPTGQAPGLLPIGAGAILKFVSTAAAASVLQVAELT